MLSGTNFPKETALSICKIPQPVHEKYSKAKTLAYGFESERGTLDRRSSGFDQQPQGNEINRE
jgi:hypothetical protein